MRQDAQKPARKFCTRKTAKKRKTHPIQPEKGETGCVLGAGGGGSGWERIKLGAKSQSLNQNEPHSHATQAKRKPAETQSFRRFCGRGRRTWSRLPPRSARSLRATGTHSPHDTQRRRACGRTCCQIIPHTNEKSQVPQKRYLTFLAGAEGLDLGCRLGRFAAERHWRSLTPRHALRRAQPCLVAKSYRTLTKKSGTAQAIPDFFGRGRRT